MATHSLATFHTDVVRIEPLRFRDVIAVYRLERRCFPLDFWPVLDVVLALVYPRIVRLKALAGERLIGFVMGEREWGAGWIASFGVDPDFRRRGIGSELLRAVEAELDTEVIRLCVRVSNTEAIRLYERFGYRPIETWGRYYRGGEDALVMEKYPAEGHGGDFAQSGL
ncbi:MAG TPA: GNAT family N-acetyltransferase [Anaerolineales bacterium]|nr:GNAT family N-acetyltransferase [Anaerolineales bacterium]